MKISPPPKPQIPKTLPTVEEGAAATPEANNIPVIPELPDTIFSTIPTAVDTMMKEALQLSFVVYDPLDHVENQMPYSGFTHIKPLDIHRGDVQALCAVRNNRACIAFRGSASGIDWLLDFLCFPAYWPLRHFGFGFAWNSARGAVRAWLESLPPEVTELMICGHSLGGGIAHLAAFELAKEYNIVGVMTFGAPRACFLGTAKKYSATKIKDGTKTLHNVTFSVVNQRDIVAKVPLWLMGFRGVGQLIYIDQREKVHFGDAAHKAKDSESFADFDFLMGFMNEEKTGALKANTAPAAPPTATEKFYSNMRKVVVWLGQASPILRNALVPILMYILFCMYFMRSGLAHLGDKYMRILLEPQPDWKYTAYEKTRAEKKRGFIIRLVMGGVLLFLFGLGLVKISLWSVSAFLEKV